MSDCVFCELIRNGEIDHMGGDASMPSVAFEPLNPVTPGHLLVVPQIHVEDALERPAVTGAAMEYAAVIARFAGYDSCNLITSVGAPATQTVKHLHIHIIPRREGDGLALPWTGQFPAQALPCEAAPVHRKADGDAPSRASEDLDRQGR